MDFTKMTEHKLTKFETECTGKFKINKDEEVIYQYPQDYVCRNCFRKLMDIYLQEINDREIKKGSTKLKRMRGK